uniref:ATP synthase complex subunit 8 n=1 Tax=Australolacerta australis TaxID=410868 RepID=A0A8A3WLQ1_9SAUR|nr:ATP synthase F0 subunit 8 [Australolacerta australis]QTA72620.1 ATP synthase F0 subunit 8 [Australolacerta australis]
MPQLNLTPWLLIFLLTWTTFILLLTKILLNLNTTLTSQYNQKPHNMYWTWPWL